MSNNFLEYIGTLPMIIQLAFMVIFLVGIIISFVFVIVICIKLFKAKSIDVSVGPIKAEIDSPVEENENGEK